MKVNVLCSDVVRSLVLCTVVLATVISGGCGRSPHYFSGRVVRVLDGDTLEVLSGGRAFRIRLHGIDCPERGQPFANRARQYAAHATLESSVSVRVVEFDRYDRIVGIVTFANGRNLNHELVSEGLAWWYREFAPDDRNLAQLEDDARSNRRGLWSATKPIAPWEWRKGSR
jgi:micrococcal nuclease